MSTYDPQLHTIRSVSRATADPRMRSEIAGARLALYTALDRGDATAARQWARALRVALEVLHEDVGPASRLGAAVASALEALGEIETGLRM